MRLFVPLDCEAVTEGLSDYLEDALPPGRRAPFEHHLATCALCARRLHQLRQTLQRLATLPTEPMPTPLKEHLLRAHPSRRSA